VDHLVRTADVQVGDVVVTSGVGGAFPSGLQVGSIVIASSPKVGVFREAELEPVVEFESLEEVMVVTSRPGVRKEEKTVQVQVQDQVEDQVDKEPEVEVVDETPPEVYKEKPKPEEETSVEEETE
jgi:rod shape-determining protein MreC